jgi:hypothetical protein
MEGAAFEITVFTKDGGPLTKRIALARNGAINGDGSTCLIARGSAERARLTDVAALAALIERLRSDQAITLGRLRPGLPDCVEIVTKRALNGVPLMHGGSAWRLAGKVVPPDIAAEVTAEPGIAGEGDSLFPELGIHQTYKWVERS